MLCASKRPRQAAAARPCRPAANPDTLALSRPPHGPRLQEAAVDGGRAVTPPGREQPARKHAQRGAIVRVAGVRGDVGGALARQPGHRQVARQLHRAPHVPHLTRAALASYRLWWGALLTAVRRARVRRRQDAASAQARYRTNTGPPAPASASGLEHLGGCRRSASNRPTGRPAAVSVRRRPRRLCAAGADGGRTGSTQPGWHARSRLRCAVCSRNSAARERRMYTGVSSGLGSGWRDSGSMAAPLPRLRCRSMAARSYTCTDSARALPSAQRRARPSA